SGRMRLPPSSAAWRMAACRRRGSAAGSGRAASSVASVRARQPACASPPASGIAAVAGRGERLRALGVVRVAEQPHAQFGLLQRGLAAAVEADARLVGGQRFREAHVAVLHLLDQLLERVEGALEIGDGGPFGVVLGHGAILSRAGRRSYTLPEGSAPGSRLQARPAPLASSQAASVADTMRSPAASTVPSASDSSGSCARSQGGTAR